MSRIKETDVKDSQGSVVISPGLKVRHKDSQYEYTVDSVINDESGNLQIVLRLPDEPRFDPEPESGEVITSKSDSRSNLIYEIDPDVMYYEPEDHETETGLISVDEDEFEKEYEVK